MKLVVRRLNDARLFKLNVKLPEHVHKIYDELNTDDINSHLEEKKRVDYNDNLSISSYDAESENTTSNKNNNN